MALKQGGAETGILEADFKIKLDDSKPLARKPIGFVSRGGFSQARGHGMAFGVICTDQLQLLLQVNQVSLTKNVKGQMGKMALFRKPNSLAY